MRVRDWSCVASCWSESIASKPIASIRSTISLGPIRVRLKLTVHVSVARETDTDVIPGIAERPASTVLVQDEQVIPYIRSRTRSSRICGIGVASKPMSDISWIYNTDSGKLAEEVKGTYVDEFINAPMFWIILDGHSLCQKSDFDRMDTLLTTEDAFYCLQT